jgi:hypothetical protein
VAISEVAVIAVNAAGSGDASSATLDLAATTTTGGGGGVLFVAHEGAPTTYTWTSQSGGSGGTFTALGTVNSAAGGSSGDFSLNATFVRGFTPGASHVFRVTLGAARPFRYGGGVVLGGTFDASFLSGTAQTAELVTETTIDAGTLTTDAAAYLMHIGCNYTGQSITAAGSGWTTKSNGTAGRHFQARNEASSGTFDPSFTIGAAGNSELTIAMAIKEAAGGSSIAAISRYYAMMRGTAC